LLFAGQAWNVESRECRKEQKMGEESEKWQQTGRKGSFEHFRRKKMMRYWIGMFNVAAK